MPALRVAQKDGEFYPVGCGAGELLRKARFPRRHNEGEEEPAGFIGLGEGALDFDAGRFVPVSSARTRKGRSHPVDLMERVKCGAAPEKKRAAWMVARLRGDSKSPLRCRMNQPWGRRGRDRRILQPELSSGVRRPGGPRRASAGGRSLRESIEAGHGWERRGQATGLFTERFRPVLESAREGGGRMLSRALCMNVPVRAPGDIRAFEEGAGLERLLRENSGPGRSGRPPRARGLPGEISNQGPGRARRNAAPGAHEAGVRAHS
ncbi:MAG: hypothetical protein ACUVV6_07305 [Thermoplasmatota archaeon]